MNHLKYFSNPLIKSILKLNPWENLSIKVALKLLGKTSYVRVHSDISKVFLGRWVHASNPRMCHHCWCLGETFPKSVHPNTLKMHSQALSVLRFLCKTFSKLLKFTSRNTLLWGQFFKN